MTKRIILLAAIFGALALAGCGRGERPEARVAPGPTLRILQPRTGQHFPIWDHDRKLGWVEVLFTKDDLGDEHRIRFTVGDGAPTEVKDIHTALIRKPVEGTHVVRGWLIDEAGKPLETPGARAEVMIHVGDEHGRGLDEEGPDEEGPDEED